MNQKVKTKTVRNKEQSKQKLLNAVGTILRTKGYTALKVNDIAATSGLDKKLIYNYFGSVDGLIDHYIRSLDFWSNVSAEDASTEITDAGRAFSQQLLVQQYDYVNSNKELQELLLWGLAESRKTLRDINAEREKSGELMLKAIADPHFGNDAADFRAAMAILISGTYYLNMYTTNADTFCGIDLTTEQGRTQIKNTLKKMLDMLYDNFGKG